MIFISTALLKNMISKPLISIFNMYDEPKL